MKLTKRNKVRLIIAMVVFSILFAVIYIPVVVAPLLVIGMAVGLVEVIIFWLEELFGYDFSED